MKLCKKLFLIALNFSATFCVSTGKKDVWRDPKNQAFKKVLETSSQQCMSTSNPQLLAYINAKGLPQQKLEMIWNQNLSELQANVLSPLGDALVSIQIQQKENGDVDVVSSGLDTSQTYFKNLKEFFEKVGPKNLRSFFCAQHVLAKDYLVQNQTWPVDLISIETQENKKNWNVDAHSKISHGSFYKTEVAEVVWRGEVNSKGTLLPKNVGVTLFAGDFDVGFQMLEFE